MVVARGYPLSKAQSIPEQALMTGLTFGTMFVMTRSLVLPMVAHAAFHLTAIALIYCNLEARVAHLVFGLSP